jgi:hypothetical protein
MPRNLSSFVMPCLAALGFVVLAFASGACGGKIADDPAAKLDDDNRGASGSSGQNGSGNGPSQTPATSGSDIPSPTPFHDPTPEPSSKPSVMDACDTICKRDGQCGALQTDCLSRCTDDILAAADCSSEGSAYIHCYADNLQPGCAALPPICEPAYCAYTRCAGKVVPNYCR